MINIRVIIAPTRSGFAASHAPKVVPVVSTSNMDQIMDRWLGQVMFR